MTLTAKSRTPPWSLDSGPLPRPGTTVWHSAPNFPPSHTRAPTRSADTAFLQTFDADQDGTLDSEDNCAATHNPDQSNTDADGIGDACDNYTLRPNAVQANADRDGYGNLYDADLNNDGAIGMGDIAEILASANTNANPAADLNGDGGMGMDDVAVALGMTNTEPGPSGLACAGSVPCGAGSLE